MAGCGERHIAVKTRGKIKGAASHSNSLEIPWLPSLWRRRGGFLLDFQVRFDDLAPYQLLFDSRDESGKGITISLTDRATLQITLCGVPWSSTTQRQGNGIAQSSCDAGVIQAGKWHHVTVIVDGGPKIISWILDEEFCDGGTT